jgi:hypothetical protein
MNTRADAFDAFEKRLHERLISRADLMPVPSDGLALINARAVRRRRRRHQTWVLVAAAVLLVLGGVGIALRSATTTSAPYVNTSPTADPISEDTTSSETTTSSVDAVATQEFVELSHGRVAVPEGFKLLTHTTPSPVSTGTFIETLLFQPTDSDSNRPSARRAAVALWPRGEVSLAGYEPIEGTGLRYDARSGPTPDPDWNTSIALTDGDWVILVNGRNLSLIEVTSIARGVSFDGP